MAVPNIALITGLEPLAGAGFAINLAYLALNRFRYRSEIEPAAEKKCLKNDEEGSFEGFQELDAVKELKWLARRKASGVFVPKGRAAMVYRHVYRKHQDIYFTAGAATLCAFTLAAGVAMNVGRWSWAHFLTYKPLPGLLFYGCLAAVLVPVALVLMGRRCAKWGKDRIEYCTAQVAISLGALASSAEPPTVGRAARVPVVQEPQEVAPGVIYDPVSQSFRRKVPGE
jgi:hypothetical protein